MKKMILWSIPALLLAGIVYAGITYSERVINKTCAAIGFADSIDLQEWSRISVHAIYEDAAPSTSSVVDGEFATTSITVTNYDSLDSDYASVKVNIQSTTSLSGEYVTLNGVVFTAGSVTQNSTFAVGADTSTTATSLSLVVAAHPDFTATASGSTVTVKAVTKGTAANSWTAASSAGASIMTVSAATFSGGVAATTIDIGGLATLTEGTDFDSTTSNSATAKSISDAIVGNAALSAVITSTWSGDVVYSTSVVPGSAYNYYVNISTTAFTVENGMFTGGADSDIVSNVFTEADHGLTTGLAVLLGVSAGTAPQNLTDQATYYVIPLTDDTYSLATSTTNANAGTAITVSTFTGSGTFTLTPIAFSAGSCGFRWEGSNNDSDWYNLDTTITSVTYSTDGNLLVDVGEVNYRYLRCNYTAPTYGGLELQVYIGGKKD